MKPEEAIKRIDRHIAVHRLNEPYAIHILEALLMAKDALEKQIPKKPIHSKKPRYGMGETYFDYVCPTCGHFVCYEPQGDVFFAQARGTNVCVRCLQRFDWTEGEG